MPERTSYAQGTPNWADLPTTDQAAAKAFYAGLFGWTYDDQPMGEGQVYSMAMLGGHQVAAISGGCEEMAATWWPPSMAIEYTCPSPMGWSSYVQPKRPA